MENLNNENKSDNKEEEIIKINENIEKDSSKKNKKSKKKPKISKEPKKPKLSEEEIAKFREKENTINDLFIAYYKTLLNFSDEEFSEFL